MPTWRRPARCDTTTCVEVANMPDGRIGLRNSAHPDRVIVMVAADWVGLCAAVKAGL